VALVVDREIVLANTLKLLVVSELVFTLEEEDDLTAIVLVRLLI
jgi:hypothetical protein